MKRFSMEVMTFLLPKTFSDEATASFVLSSSLKSGSHKSSIKISVLPPYSWAVFSAISVTAFCSFSLVSFVNVRIVPSSSAFPAMML